VDIVNVAQAYPHLLESVVMPEIFSRVAIARWSGADDEHGTQSSQT